MHSFGGLSSVFAFVALVVLAGCGGGGSSGSSDNGSKFSINPGSLTFSTSIDQEAPASQVVVVTARETQTETPDTIYNDDVIDSVITSFPNDNTMNIEVTVKAPYFLDAGVHTTSLIVENSQNRITIPVTYNISTMPPADPEITYVSPYVSREGVPSNVAIRGGGFDQLNAGAFPVINVGNSPATDIEIISDSHINMTVPGLSEGIYPITFSGTGIDFPSTANLHVIPDQTFQSANIPSVGDKSRIIFDKQRSALYVINTTVGVLERYRFQSGTSWQLDQLFVAGVTDATLSPDGETLVLVDGTRFYEVELGTASMTLGKQGEVELATYSSLDRVAAGSNGIMYGVSNNQWTPIYTYDLATGETGTLKFRNSQGTLLNHTVYQPYLFPSPDGAEIYLGERGITRSILYRLNTSENILSETGLEKGLSGFRSLDISQDGLLALINGKDFYDKNLNQLGSLPSTHTSAAFSPDGSIVYVFNKLNSTESNVLSKFDISNPASPQQVGETVSLADGPMVARGMTIANDGNTLFLSGANHVQVVDLTSLEF